MLWSEVLSPASEFLLRAGRLLRRSSGGDGPSPGRSSLSPKCFVVCEDVSYPRVGFMEEFMESLRGPGSLPGVQ